MDLRLSEEQEFIKTTVHDFLEEECPRTLVREMIESPKGYSPELWQKMAEMGFMGVMAPESCGGMGGSFLDLCILLEEQGRFRMPSPFFSTVALCATAIARFGVEAQQQEWLSAIAEGKRVMTYVPSEPHGTGVVKAAADKEGFRLDGESLFIPFARQADAFLVAARAANDGIAVTTFLVDADTSGITCEPMDTLDFDCACRVHLKGVPVSAERVLGAVNEGGSVAAAIDAWGAAGKCAEMVGGMECVVEMAVEYAKTRTQFGRPIGSFQAIQHHCANMAVDLITSRFMAYEAIWRLSEGLDASEEVAMAKAWVSDAYQRVCALGHQILGAIGFTWEHDMHLYTRHAKASETAFGDGACHREAIAQALGL